MIARLLLCTLVAEAVHGGWVCESVDEGALPPRGCPQSSDVAMRSLTPHFTAQPPPGRSAEGAGQGLYDTFGAVKAFGVNKLWWIYSANGSFVNDSWRHGIEGVSLSINANLPDPHKNGSSGSSQYTIGRARNVDLQPITAPWMRQWAVPPHYGCVNNPDYRSIVASAIQAALAAGADAIQHDDPATNWGTTDWDQGDPHGSGCYCDHCMGKFTAVLPAILNSSTKERLNFNSSWNYRLYLLSRRNNTDAPTDDAALLRALFVQFQMNSTIDYLQYVRKLLAASNRSIPLSCNNLGRWTPPYDECDLGLGELSWSAANPGALQAILNDTVPTGRSQIMTSPKKANITADDVPAMRLAIATAYALGSQLLVPWDVYLPTPVATRYYGSAADFADIYALPRNMPALFDNTYALDMGGNASKLFKLNHTGAGGDGARYRLPTDTTNPNAGKCPESVSTLVACELECLNDPRCVAIYSGGNDLGRVGGMCCLLYTPLELVPRTSLHGLTYLRLSNGSIHKAPYQVSSNFLLYARHERGEGQGLVLHVLWSGSASLQPSTVTVHFPVASVDGGDCTGLRAVTIVSTFMTGGPARSPVPLLCRNDSAIITATTARPPWLIMHIYRPKPVAKSK